MSKDSPRRTYSPKSSIPSPVPSQTGFNRSAIVLPSAFAPNEILYEDKAKAYYGLRIEQQHIWLKGFEVYAVEQWVVDRNRVVPTIVVFTGDERHQIAVDVYTLDTTVTNYRQGFDSMMSRLKQDGARPKETHLGFIHVTILPNFKANLNIVKIPGGSLPEIKDELYANIDLRRFGCGGRSGLSLQEPSQAQQDKFLQMYRLPSPSNNDHLAFNKILLSFVKLLQSALALFGKGPCFRTSSYLIRHHDPRLSLPRPQDEYEADGLLCDFTVAGITEWALEMGEHLAIHEPGESVLPAAVLASIVSIVLEVRSKLSILGPYGHMLRDPFNDTKGLLKAYISFLRTQKIPLQSKFLSPEGLKYIRKAYEQRHNEGFGVRRAIRSKLEDLTRDLNVNQGKLAEDSKYAQEEETEKLEVLIRGLNLNWAPDVESVQSVFAGKVKGASRRQKGHGHKKSSLSGGERGTTTDGTGTETEADVPSVYHSRNILKNVGGKTAARAGKFLNDAHGFLERFQEPGSYPDFMRPSNRVDVTHGASDRDEIILGAPVTDSDLLGPRSALSSEVNLRPPVSKKNSSHNGEIFLDAIPTRPGHMKRSYTEYGPVLPDSGAASDYAIEISNQPFFARPRSNSYSTPDDIESLPYLMTLRRLKMDVEMAYTFRQLRQRERELAECVAALEEIDRATAAAFAALSEPFSNRQAQVQALQLKARSIDPTLGTEDGETGSPVDPSPGLFPTNALTTGNERLRYAQNVLQDKVNDLAEFAELETNKIGPEGTITVGLGKVLSRGPNTGIRKFVATLTPWRMWLDYLGSRLHYYTNWSVDQVSDSQTTVTE